MHVTYAHGDLYAFIVVGNGILVLPQPPVNIPQAPVGICNTYWIVQGLGNNKALFEVVSRHVPVPHSIEDIAYLSQGFPLVLFIIYLLA